MIRLLLIFTIVLTSFGQETADKCGTIRHLVTVDAARKARVTAPVSSRPVLQGSVVTPNGKIRIHFDTTGANTPAMLDGSGNRIANSYRQYIDTVRSLLEIVWKTEIDQFGFAAPPSDQGRDGGNEYDVYIMNLGNGLFGETIPDGDLPVGPSRFNQAYCSHFRIDNDFGAGYRTKGIPAVMATCAHEFHHSVQMGSAGIWDQDYLYFYELSAESMENTVFVDARDYLFDLKTYFTNVSVLPMFATNSQTSYDGYERAVFGMFLMKKFGPGIMNDIWNGIATQRPVQSLNAVLSARSTSIAREFADFVFWNFHTAHRADTVQYYTDGKQMPLVPFAATISANAGQNSVGISSHPFTASYFKIFTPSDSAFAMVCHTDVQDALLSGTTTRNATLTVTTNASAGLPQLSSSVFASVTSDAPQYWSLNASIPKRFTACFPNPFNPAKSSLLFPIAPDDDHTEFLLTVISPTTSERVFQGTIGTTYFSGIRYAEWKGRDDRGSLVSSGVYIYILSRDGNHTKGKFAVLR